MRHEHHGMSSEGFIDARRLLGSAGLLAGSVVLDAGCGEGYISLAASEITGPDGFVYALDIFEESLVRLEAEISKRGIRNIKTLKADLTDRVFLPDTTVDFCILANVLHGFVVNGEDGKALEEIARVVKRGSLLVVVEFKKIDSPGPPFDQRITPEETSACVGEAGFGLERVFDAGPFHYAAVCGKK